MADSGYQFAVKTVTNETYRLRADGVRVEDDVIVFTKDIEGYASVDVVAVFPVSVVEHVMRDDVSVLPTSIPD